MYLRVLIGLVLVGGGKLLITATLVTTVSPALMSILAGMDVPAVVGIALWAVLARKSKSFFSDLIGGCMAANVLGVGLALGNVALQAPTVLRRVTIKDDPIAMVWSEAMPHATVAGVPGLVALCAVAAILGAIVLRRRRPRRAAARRPAGAARPGAPVRAVPVAPAPARPAAVKVAAAAPAARVPSARRPAAPMRANLRPVGAR
jgi:hypothetical protein